MSVTTKSSLLGIAIANVFAGLEKATNSGNAINNHLTDILNTGTSLDREGATQVIDAYEEILIAYPPFVEGSVENLGKDVETHQLNYVKFLGKSMNRHMRRARKARNRTIAAGFVVWLNANRVWLAKVIEEELYPEKFSDKNQFTQFARVIFDRKNTAGSDEDTVRDNKANNDFVYQVAEDLRKLQVAFKNKKLSLDNLSEVIAWLDGPERALMRKETLAATLLGQVLVAEGRPETVDEADDDCDTEDADDDGDTEDADEDGDTEDADEDGDTEDAEDDGDTEDAEDDGDTDTNDEVGAGSAGSGGGAGGAGRGGSAGTDEPNGGPRVSKVDDILRKSPAIDIDDLIRRFDDGALVAVCYHKVNGSVQNAVSIIPCDASMVGKFYNEVKSRKSQELLGLFGDVVISSSLLNTPTCVDLPDGGKALAPASPVIIISLADGYVSEIIACDISNLSAPVVRYEPSTEYRIGNIDDGCYIATNVLSSVPGKDLADEIASNSTMLYVLEHCSNLFDVGIYNSNNLDAALRFTPYTGDPGVFDDEGYTEFMTAVSLSDETLGKLDEHSAMPFLKGKAEKMRTDVMNVSATDTSISLMKVGRITSELYPAEMSAANGDIGRVYAVDFLRTINSLNLIEMVSDIIVFITADGIVKVRAETDNVIIHVTIPPVEVTEEPEAPIGDSDEAGPKGAAKARAKRSQRKSNGTSGATDDQTTGTLDAPSKAPRTDNSRTGEQSTVSDQPPVPTTDHGAEPTLDNNPQPEVLAIIKDIAAGGVNCAHKITDELNNRGIPPIHGKKWYHSAVLALLGNNGFDDLTALVNANPEATRNTKQTDQA